MRILVAGGTGVLGRAIIPRLVAAGHDVFGTTRSAARGELIGRAGAQALVMDALNRESVSAAVSEARPEAVIHVLTALPPEGPSKPSDLDATNRLRTEGTANLLAASRAAGVGRFVAESFIGVYGLGGESLLSEDEPLPAVDGAVSSAAAPLRALEEQVLAAGGIVLRYGLLYGRGVPSTEAAVARLRRRALPLPGGAPGMGTWVHIEDAASATLAALDRADGGAVLNVVDDEPVSFGDFFRELAGRVGAPRPWSVPVWLGRLLAPYATRLAVEARLSVSNARIRAELGWQPTYATYRDGLREMPPG